jgi:hypothetical protein
VKVATGASAGVAAVTMLQVFGAMGTIMAASIVIGYIIGTAGVINEVRKK